MVRQMMYAQYREETYTRGFNVVTTIDSADQQVAYTALRKGIMDYERRHGYRGPEGFIELPAGADDREQAIDDALLEHPDNGELIAAVVTAASPRQITVAFIDGSNATIEGDNLRFASGALSANAQPNRRIRPGAIVRVVKNDAGKWSITQLPQVEGHSCRSSRRTARSARSSAASTTTRTSSTTSRRRGGSRVRRSPFIYSASLDKGLGPATVINDGPLYFSAAETGGQPWEPKNYGGGFEGPMSMRTALQRSRNLVSIRILNHIGTKYAQQYITRFGFDAERHPAYLPMALGAGQVTPLQMAGAYSVFANGGYRVNPYLIAEVTDPNGAIVVRAQPLVAEQNAPRAIDPRNAYVMNSLLQSVAQRGTGARTNVLKRTDLAGKTGTTNDSHDAWFAGYQHTLAAIAWIGYDNPRSLGDRETGRPVATGLDRLHGRRAEGRPRVRRRCRTASNRSAASCTSPSSRRATASCRRSAYRRHRPRRTSTPPCRTSTSRKSRTS